MDPNFNFSFFQRIEGNKCKNHINADKNGEIFDALNFNSIVLPKI